MYEWVKEDDVAFIWSWAYKISEETFHPSAVDIVAQLHNINLKMLSE